MDFGLIGKIANSGNGTEEHRGHIPPEIPEDLPFDITSIERDQLMVITSITLESGEKLSLDDEVRVFWDRSHLDGTITMFEIERNSIKGHKMLIHVSAPLFHNKPVKFATTKYQFAKKITP